MTFLQVVGYLISLVARVVLLFSGIPFLVGSVAFARLIFELWANYRDELMRPAHINVYSVALLASVIYLLSFAVYGIYVAIFSYKHGLQRLTIIGLMTLTIGVLVFMLTSPSLVKLDNESLTRLHHYQGFYDWSHHDWPNSQMPTRQATLLWDYVQESLRCCGYKNPEDWARYKPVWLLGQDVLPRTCCRDIEEARIRGGGYCRADMHRWTMSCSEEVHNAVKQFFGMIGSSIYFGLMSSLLSGVILLCHPYEISDNYYEAYVGDFNVYHHGQPNPNTINVHSGLIDSKN